jgi:two-component system chemotaxis response regulator CheY
MSADASKGSSADSGRKRRVVLADDESHVRVYLRFLLAGMGLDVVGEATNGLEAINLFRDKKPDLILLDLNMPIKTGEEALQAIKTEFPDARVVMLSSLADRESVEMCLNLGAAGYIRKDSSLNDIREIIKETLESS